MPTLASAGGRPPAIVMGLSANGLGVLRSLVRLGVEVHGVYSDPGAEIARHSRSLEARYRVRDPQSMDQVMVTLHAIRRRVRHDGPLVLIPTNDTFARFVSLHRTELEGDFVFRAPPLSIAATFLDKRATVALCQQEGMPIPRSIVPTSIADIEREAARQRFPVIVKPSRTDDAAFPGKNVVLTSAAELLDFFTARPELVPRVMFQELIPSGDGHIVVVSTYSGADGRVLASSSGRKLRQWLPDFGSGTYSVSEALPSLQLATASFLERIGYVGFASIEFAEDVRTGEHVFLELNARTVYRNQLFVDAGVDLTAVGYLEMCGLPTPTGLVQRDGVYWMDLHRDLPSSLVKWRRGQLGVHEWLRSVRRTTSHATFDRHDPKPFMASLVRLASIAAGSSSGRQIGSLGAFAGQFRRRRPGQSPRRGERQDGSGVGSTDGPAPAPDARW